MIVCQVCGVRIECDGTTGRWWHAQRFEFQYQLHCAVPPKEAIFEYTFQFDYPVAHFLGLLEP